MARRRTLRLKTREQRELEYYRDHDGRPYVRERCSAVLKVAAGEAPHAVARQLSITHNSHPLRPSASPGSNRLGVSTRATQ